MCPILNGFRDRGIWLSSGLAWAPNIGVPGVVLCLTDTSLYIYICVKHFGMANVKFIINILFIIELTELSTMQYLRVYC